MWRAMVALLLALISPLHAGCRAPPFPSPAPLPDGATAAPPPPLALVADRVSDRIELYAVAPSLSRVAEWSVYTNPAYVPNEPFDLAVSPDRESIYVVMGHSVGAGLGTLLKLRLADGARLGEVVVGEQPSMMALSSDGSRAYVALFRNLAHPSGPWSDRGALAVIDTTAMKLLATVEACAAPMGVALDEKNERVWVACLGDDQLALISLAGAPKLDQLVPLTDGNVPASQPAYVLLDDAHAFVTAQGSGELWVLERLSGKVVKRLPFGSDAFPQRLALSADGKMVFVNVDYANRIAAVSTSALLELASVALPGVAPQGIALSHDGSFALVTDESDLKSPGRLVRVTLENLLGGGAHFTGSAASEIFPQAVLLIE